MIHIDDKCAQTLMIREAKMLIFHCHPLRSVLTEMFSRRGGGGLH